MWLLLLSLLATESVQSASIGYPYGSFLAYSPQKSASVHGYLRLLDNYGTGDLVGYNNPQPAYAVRQIKYINSAAPTLETIEIKNAEEITKARETYLRAASLQHYQHLKNGIDALKAEGKEPSAEKLTKLQMLKKIAFTSDFSLIAELPEVKSTLHELEESISGLYREPVQQFSTNNKQSIGETKTYVGNTNIPEVAIEESPVQKQARENHLRIYNEQIANLKQLELEHEKYLQASNLKSKTPQSPNEDKQIDKQIDNSMALAVLEEAQKEHFRLWNEAKLRAEQPGYDSGERGIQKTADQQQISETTNDQNIYKSKQTMESIQDSAKLSSQFEEQSIKSSPQTLQLKHQLSDQAKVLKDQTQIAEQSAVVDTPEVIRAREEHLRIVNEAILRSQQIVNTNAKDKKEKLSLQIQTEISPAFNYRAEQSVVEETAEVKKAREEHLRLVQEANQRAQFVEQQELQYKQKSQVPILKSQYEQHQQYTHQPEIADGNKGNANQFNTYLSKQNQMLSNIPQQQLESETQMSGETAEVKRAREEHLRLFNAIKAHTEQEQAKQSSRIFPHPQSELKPILDFAMNEEHLLELERLREMERLQKEHELLELDRLRETQRLAEEKLQMDAELVRLRIEEQQRLEMERLSEEKRLLKEQEEYKAAQSGEYQEILMQNESPDTLEEIIIMPATSEISNQQNQQFANNPFLKLGQVSNVPATVEQERIQQNTEIVNQQSNQQFVNNPFLKVNQISSAAANRLEHSVDQSSSTLKSMSVQIPSADEKNIVPDARYITPSHPSNSSKHQYKKDEKDKHNYYYDSASYQPADTAVALIALQKATNDHFRAHELALEQLRIARIKNPSVKDCN